MEELTPPVEDIFSLMEEFSRGPWRIYFSHWQWVEEYFGDFEYIILFNSESEIPPPDPMGNIHAIGFYGDRVLRLLCLLRQETELSSPCCGSLESSIPLLRLF